MGNNCRVGKRSLFFKGAPFILESASIVGTKEGQGPCGAYFDLVGEDDKFGQASWEQAESCMQKDSLNIALGKSGLEAEDIRYVFAGDLLGQTMATSFGLKDYEIPFYGVYGACSTCGEALSLGAAFVAAGYAQKVATVTSSHFGSAEKQFRFPLEYANQRPKSATWTVTGSGAFIISEPTCKEAAKAQISGITTGVMVDYGIKDSMNMGAAMAPAAAETIAAHLNDFEITPEEYDRIVTGDLGLVGTRILLDLLKERGIDIESKHEDCGVKIYDNATQGTGAGGSGCGCSATMLSAYYLPKLAKGELKKVLFVPTGALLSPVSFNEGESIPGIAHAVVLEGINRREI